MGEGQQRREQKEEKEKRGTSTYDEDGESYEANMGKFEERTIDRLDDRRV